MEKMKLVVPTIPQDIGKLLKNIGIYFNFLPIKEICVIGSGKVEALLPQNYPIVFINENELVDFDAIKNLIVRRTRNNEAGKRAGWYVQQFIKMGFARTCPDDFYLLWDSDTVPLKPVNMLEAGNPIFDCKTEYHEPYFKTIEKLFPNLKKCIEGSFISEHMIIKTSLMRQMLNEIEANVALEGDNFAEKIINAVPVEDLGKSGFSEFETYGTYVQSKFPDEYSLREWRSLRCGGLFFDGALSATTVSWLARYYDAISFENWDELSRACKIVSSSWYEKLFRANTLEVWAFFVRVYRRKRERKVR